MPRTRWPDVPRSASCSGTEPDPRTSTTSPRRKHDLTVRPLPRRRPRPPAATALSFIRYDEPIDWKGSPATYVVGIAGAGDDHLTVLQALPGAFTDDASLAALAAAQTPDDVLAVLAEKV